MNVIETLTALGHHITDLELKILDIDRLYKRERAVSETNLQEQREVTTRATMDRENARRTRNEALVKRDEYFGKLELLEGENDLLKEAVTELTVKLDQESEALSKCKTELMSVRGSIDIVPSDAHP